MMTRTTLTSTVAAALLTAGLITGCDRPANTPKPVAEAEAQKSKAAEQSVALPPQSTPPSDATIKPAEPAPQASAGSPPSQSQTPGSSGQAGGQTQSTPQDLTKAQETNSLPLSGQANNHSTPESTDKSSAAK